jgi:hypothetical protein
VTPEFNVNAMSELCPNVKYEAVSKTGKKLSTASAVKILKGSAFVNNYD